MPSAAITPRVPTPLSPRRPAARCRVMLYACVMVVGCGGDTFETPSTDEGVESGYEVLLRQVDEEIRGARALAEMLPGSWMPLERLAGAHLSRARLTGELAEYGLADDALVQAFQNAPPGGGPNLTQARLLLRTHQVEAADRALDRSVPLIATGADPLAERLGLGGDIALFQLDFRAAADLYGESESLDPNGTSAFRLALHAWQRGAFDEADNLLMLSASRRPASALQQRALVSLHRGLIALDQGRYEAALAHYRDAEALVSGWWLVEEHIAEVQVLRGYVVEAAGAYATLVARTGRPDLMAAYAEVHDLLGDAESAEAMRGDAERLFREQVSRYPAAAGGHALAFFIDRDPGYAYRLARAQTLLRPDGATLVLAARAALTVGATAEAGEMLGRVLASPYVSAELFVTAHDVARARAMPAAAEVYAARARAINPHVFSREP